MSKIHLNPTLTIRARIVALLLLGLPVLGPLAGCDMLNPPERGPAYVAPTAAPRASQAGSAASGTTVRVERKDLAAQLKLRGRVVAKNELPLAFRRTGYIKSLSVKIGDQVEKGTLLAELEGTELEDQIETSRLNLEKARAELAQAQLPLAPGEAAVLAAAAARAESSVEAAKLKLVQLKDNKSSPTDLALAEAAVQAARAALEDAKGEYGHEAYVARPIDVEKATAELQRRRDLQASSTDIAVAEVAVRVAEAGYLESRGSNSREHQLAMERQLEAARLNLQRAQELKATSIDVAMAEANLRAALAAQQEAKAKYQREVESLKPVDVETAALRLQKLKEQRANTTDVALAEAEIAAAEAALAEAKARHARASLLESLGAAQREATIAIRQTQLQLAEADAGRLQRRLDDLKLVAPFSGSIVSLEVRLGDKVDPHQTLGILADPAEVMVEATVPEEQLPWVSPGQEAEVAMDGFPDQRYRARVVQIASKPTLWQGKRVYETLLAFDDRGVPTTIRMGSDVYLAVTRTQVLVLPMSALQADGDRKYVQVPSGTGGTSKMPVSVGLTNHVDAEIISGVKEGDDVITALAR